MGAGRKVLIQLTGSIAAYKTCTLISRLVQHGDEVRTVCTRSALRFVGAATLEGLSGHPVYTDMFQPGVMMEHIHLAKWADLMLVCPASANAINRLAQGLADDWIGAIFLANNFRKPYWIAPAMNTEMYRHPATQASLETLRKWGATILETGSGMLACGDQGEGRLIEPEVIFERIRALD